MKNRPEYITDTDINFLDHCFKVFFETLSKEGRVMSCRELQDRCYKDFESRKLPKNIPQPKKKKKKLNFKNYKFDTSKYIIFK